MSLGPEGKTRELSNSNEPFSRKTIFDHFSYAIVNAVKVIRFKQKKCVNFFMYICYEIINGVNLS